MDLDVNLLQDDPKLDSFVDGNESIRRMIEGSYFTLLRQQGFAYSILFENRIVGYYMIQAGSITLTDQEVYDDADRAYGVLRLKYIIVDERYRNRRIGSVVLDSIIDYAFKVSKRVPIRFLILDALPEKCAWYSRFGFQKMPSCIDSPLTPMFIDFINQEKLAAYIESCT